MDLDAAAVESGHPDDRVDVDDRWTWPEDLRAASTCSLYAGTGEGVRFLGWSTNLQSSWA